MTDSVAKMFADAWKVFNDLGPLANLATLATPAVAVGAGAIAFFRRSVSDLHAANHALKRRLEHEEAENLKQAVTLKALRSECTALEARLADSALARAERELRDHNELKARQALELWLEQKGPPVAKLLMARADWAYGHAVGDLRPAAFAVTQAVATAALALDPRNREAPPLLADLRALAAAEAQDLPPFPAALQRVQDIAAAERVDPDQIVIAIRAAQEARRLRERGHYHLGLRVIDRAVTLFRRQIGGAALQTLDARDERAFLLTASGRYQEALTEITDVVSARTSAPRIGPHHPSTLTSRYLLAQVLSNLGDYAEARPVIEAVVAAQTACPDIGPDHPKPDEPEPISLVYPSPPGVSSGGVVHEPVSDGAL